MKNFVNFVLVLTNFIRLIIREIKTGVKYAKSRYSVGIMESIVLSIITRPSGIFWYLYEVRNAFSMHMTLTINIVLSNKMHKKGRDIIPFKWASLERMGNGPLRKKFAIPNELAIVLDIKVINGSVANDDIVSPSEFTG